MRMSECSYETRQDEKIEEKALFHFPLSVAPVFAPSIIHSHGLDITVAVDIGRHNVYHRDTIFGSGREKSKKNTHTHTLKILKKQTATGLLYTNLYESDVRYLARAIHNC